MKKLIIFITVLSLSSILCRAQSFAELRDKKGNNPFSDRWGALMVRATSITGKYTEGLTGATVNVMLRSYRYGKWSARYRFENMFLGDGIYAIVRGLDRITNDSDQNSITNRAEQTLTNGWVGSHQLNFNAVAQDRLLVAPGISTGDYTLAAKRATSSQSGSRVTDPAGYYFYAGPSVMVSYLITDKLWVDGFVNYDFTVTKAADPSQDYTENPDYPLPSLLTMGAEVSTSSRIYGAFKYIGMIDGGNNRDRGTRIDLSLGYLF